MKFWKKLVLFIIAAISIVLSCSRYYIIKSNYWYSISNRIKQNESQYSLEKYILGNSIVKSGKEGEEITEKVINEAIDTMQPAYTYIGEQNEKVAIYNENKEKLYSNIEEIDNMNVISMLNAEFENYELRESLGKHYMVFASNWIINKQVIYIVSIYDVEDVFEETNRQMQEIVVSDIIILGVSFIIIAIFAFFLTKPIKSLNKASKNIALGEFSQRVKIKNKDEIGELAENFNTMAEEIESKIQELDLQVKQKDDFINGFTHELKTPMTAIIGYSDLLRLKKCDEEISRKALNYIYSEAKRLENLSSKLMSLMSISKEKMELKSIKIKEFIDKIIKKENLRIEDNKIETDIEEYSILGDSDLLEVVIKNLVENASKAEPKDKVILITGKILENKKYRISVIDKGIGIPKEHIERLTEDFYMVDKSRSRTKGGNGIGLSLVKKILNLHNSNINIESEENIGTTVYFDLEEKEDENEN